jgi:MYXO-CTERM domain-containing protein
MKRQLTKVIGTSVIALGMALPFSVPASAQTTTDPTTAPGTTTDTRTYGDNGFDWGWLGLLGLVGLAGLAGRGRREEPTRYRDPNTVGTTNYRE